MKKKLYLPLIIFLALVAAFLVQLQRNAQGDDPKTLESALVGKPVPAKTLTDLLSTKTFDESLFKQGKPLLLNVWATWCPTCYAEHQYLNHLAKQGVPIIGLDYKDNSEKAVKWLHDLGNPYQVVLKDEKGSFALDLGVDGKGVIHYRYAGDVNERVWQEKLQPIYQKLVGAQ